MYSPLIYTMGPSFMCSSYFLSCVYFAVCNLFANCDILFVVMQGLVWVKLLLQKYIKLFPDIDFYNQGDGFQLNLNLIQFPVVYSADS